MNQQARSDAYVHDDAAYVLGALSPDERRVFEAHLSDCADCTARVAYVREVPDMLGGLSADELADEPPPDTLLPALLRRANERRRRQRWTMSALAGLAAACLVALAVAVWPFGSSEGGSAPTPRDFVAVSDAPVRADATLVSKSWGTQIDVHCSYTEGVKEAFSYLLRVVDEDGQADDLGSWVVPPDSDISYIAGTRLDVDQISKVQITKTDGTPILELDP